MYRGIKSGTLSYVRASSWPFMSCIVELSLVLCPMKLSLNPVLCSCFFLALYVMYRGAVAVCLRFDRFAPNHRQ
jgi:hypothetical protein